MIFIWWDKKEINVKSLGECLYLDSGTLTPLLKKLEAKGYITRARSENDERNLIVKITSEGEALKQKAASIPSSVSGCINLSSEEATQLYTTLYKILGQL